jgi:hypothetical protein
MCSVIIWLLSVSILSQRKQNRIDSQRKVLSKAKSLLLPLRDRPAELAKAVRALNISAARARRASKDHAIQIGSEMEDCLNEYDPESEDLLLCCNTVPFSENDEEEYCEFLMNQVCPSVALSPTEWPFAEVQCGIWCTSSENVWCSAFEEVAGFVGCLMNTEEEKDALIFGECCGKSPRVSYCLEVVALCEANKKGKLPEDVNKKEVDDFCSSYCSKIEKEPDWCSSGLSGGAIAGIVIAVVVVVGAAVGVGVFFFVRSKRGD